MFSTGDIIDRKYTVNGVCSTNGGMGTILFVTALAHGFTNPLVLKYCRETEDEYVRRFRREIRLLREFAGKSKVIQVLDQNLEHDPPYYVMDYYPDGDLTTIQAALANDLPQQEAVFCQMIDCVAELHARGTFHRDVKPQNFLRDRGQIRVSDLGLSMEHGSQTAFTKSSQWWGTPGYLPPEFHTGGFAHADAAGDIFMLGKSFYVLLTGRQPMYVVGTGIPDALFHMLQKACNIDKARRYQTLAELKQAIVAVYDVLLGRVDGIARARQLLTAINTRLEQQNQFDVDEVNGFLDAVSMLPLDQRNVLVTEVNSAFYRLLIIEPLASRISEYLTFYRPMVESADFGWSYAETIADNMQVLFNAATVSDEAKAEALNLAMHAAVAMNRFAAMGTCIQMITSVSTDTLALRVRDVLLAYPNEHFVLNIESVSCSNDTVAATVRQLKNTQAAG